MVRQPYKLELSYGEKTISFGPRRLGEVGSDIAAVKVALGSIVRGPDLPGENSSQNLTDPNGWFNCTTGLETTDYEAATFNKDMQSRLMKFQLDNHFYIVNYLFRKYGVPQMINNINDFENGKRYKDLSKASKEARKQSIALQVVDQMIHLFDSEFGELGEATISVMHGWRPQFSLSNKTYYSPSEVFTASNQITIGANPLSDEEGLSPAVIVDIVPMQLYEQYVFGNFSQKTNSSTTVDSIVAPVNIAEGTTAESLDVYRNIESHFDIFRDKAPAHYQWQPDASMPYATIIYRAKDLNLEDGSPRTSMLYSAAQTIMESQDEITRTIDQNETRAAIERALEPDPFSDPDPFVISRSRIGFFDITDFDLQNLFNHDPEVIKDLEDKALSKVLQFYGKPEIWYLDNQNIEFIDLYYGVGNTPSSPEHDRYLPHDIEDPEDKIKYWVLTTRENISKFGSRMPESRVRYYDKIEGFSSEEPLIKFIEYRTPLNMRTGERYRAYFEINYHKLNLISEGRRLSDLPPVELLLGPAESSAADNEAVAADLSNQVTLDCEDLTDEENRRRFKEYRAYAARNRREIVRKFREAAFEATQDGVENAARRRTEMSLNLGPLGTYQTNEIGTMAVELTQWVAENTNLSGVPIVGPLTTSLEDSPYNNKITVGFTELEERIEIAEKDLSEAQKQAAKEKYKFNPKNFNAKTQGQNLKNILTRIRVIIEQRDPNFGFSDTQTSLSDFLGGTGTLIPGSDTITIHFSSAGLNETEEKGIRIKKIITNNKTVFHHSIDDEPSEFAKPIAVGYLSQIKQMTGNFGGRGSGIARQVVPGTSFCSDLFSPKNGIAYLRKYTKLLSIVAPSKTEEDNFLHKTWESIEKRTIDPAAAWSEQSTGNIFNSFADVSGDFGNYSLEGFKDLTPKFGEDEILSNLGDACNPYLLRQELFNKLSLPGLLCDYLKCAKIPGFELKIPDFNFPPIPELPIFGFYTNFVDFILKKFQEIIQRIICTFIRTLLQFLEFPFCAEQFKDAFGNAQGFSPVMQEALADALFNLNLDEDDLENAQDYVDNAFRYLRGDEICRLLSGETLDPAAMNMLQRVAAFHNLEARFSTREDIEEFFSIIAGFMPSSFCDAIAEATSLAGAATCQNTTEILEEIRRRMLTGENVDDEELRAAMELAEKNLMDAIDAWNALSENGIVPLAGQYLAMGDPDALINSYPESLNNSINQTAHSVFQKAKSSYINSLSSFVSRLYTQVPSIAQPGDPNYDPIAVIKYETALMNLKAYAELQDPDSMSESPSLNDQYECLTRVYQKREMRMQEGSLPVHVKKINGVEVTRSDLQAEGAEELVEFTIVGWNKNPLYVPEEVLDPFVGTRREPEYSDFLESDAYKEFNTPRITVVPGDDGAEISPIVDEDGNASVDAKQSKISERLLELTAMLDGAFTQVFAPKTETEYMAYLKDVYNIALEDARESGSSDDDEAEMIAADTSLGYSGWHKVVKMQLPSGPWRPTLSYQEFLASPDKSSFTIRVSDSHLFPEGAEKFEYCEPVPEEYIDLEAGFEKVVSRRRVFAKHYINKVKQDFEKYNLEGTISDITDTSDPRGLEGLYPLLYGKDAQVHSYGADSRSVYVKSVEGILEQMFYSLRDARMFNEDYADGVDRRIKGRYIDGENKCIINRFNLNHFGILSFDKKITDEVSELVRDEMSLPENQPQNLDYSKPGPIEKAIQQVALKGFIKICMIEIMLKGSIPYSVWDVEGVIGEQLYEDYVVRFVISEIEKTESFNGIWPEVAERIANVPGGHAAIKKIILDEILMMPSLSKDIYDNRDRDYHNWFINQIPNVDVSGELAPENIKIGNRRIWVTGLGDNVFNDPFLSIEHYLRIDGPIADFSNILYDTDQAFQDFMSRMNSIMNPDTGLGFRDTASSYTTFSSIPRELAEMSTNGGSRGFDLSFLEGTGTEGDPAVADVWPDMEVYSITDVQNIFEQLNSLTEVFDNAIQPKFGFISDVNTSAHLMAEVIKRTPSRLIKRNRTMVTMNNTTNNLLHSSEEMQQVFYAGNSQVSLSNPPYYKTFFENLISERKTQSLQTRHYIIPGNGQLMLDAISPQAASIEDSYLRPWNEQALWNPLYNVSDSNNAGDPIRGYKMSGLNWNGEQTSFTPLDPDAPWLSQIRPQNDNVIFAPTDGRSRETKFRNIYGPVSEQDFNDLQQEILSQTQQEEEDNIETDLEEPLVERWQETCFDFKGPSSIIFNNIGESGDQAVSQWNSWNLDSARSAFRTLYDYISEETDDFGTTGGYLAEILNPLEKDPRKLVLGVRTAISEENSDMIDILEVGPAYPMTKVISNFDRLGHGDGFDNQVIYNPLRNFRKQGEEYIIEDLPEALENLKGPNDYIVPVRLLITQIIDDRDNSVKEVFSRVVLPEMLDFGDYLSMEEGLFLETSNEHIRIRAERLDAALAEIIGEYIIMIVGAYNTISSEDASPAEKYKKVMEKFKNFPFFLRQPSLKKVDINRKSFCSVAKIYSYACKAEAENAQGAFSRSQTSVDKLFADPGYLMKSTSTTDPQDTLSYYTALDDSLAAVGGTAPSNNPADYDSLSTQAGVQLAIIEARDAIDSIKHLLYGPTLNYDTRGDWGRRPGIEWFNENFSNFEVTDRVLSLVRNHAYGGESSIWQNFEEQTGLTVSLDNLSSNEKKFRNLIRIVYRNIESGRDYSVYREGTRGLLQSIVGGARWRDIPHSNASDPWAILINMASMAGGDQPGIWHIILDSLESSLEHLEENDSFPQIVSGEDQVKYILAATAVPAATGDVSNPEQKYINAFRNQQKFGLNFLYQAAMNLDGLNSVVSSKMRANKLALSIANIFNWFDERRKESFWGRTTRSDFLKKSINFGYTEEVEIASIASNPNALTAEGETAAIPIRKVLVPPGTEIEVLNEEHISAHVYTWGYSNNGSNRARDFRSYRAAAETRNIMCGFSPFLNDNRYHIEELLEAYKRKFASITGASVNQNLEQFLNGYVTLLDIFINQLEQQEGMSKLGSSADVFNNLEEQKQKAYIKSAMNFSKYEEIIKSTRSILTSMSRQFVSDAPAAPLEAYITSFNLPVSSVFGFPGMPAQHKMTTLFTEKRYDTISRRITSDSGVNFRRRAGFDLYRQYYGIENSKLIVRHAQSFIQRAVQYQHDSWVCLLENIGLWYFYQIFQNTFMEALQAQVGRSFAESTIHHCARLLHNTPKEDAKTIWEMYKQAEYSEAFGNVSNEERAYMTYVKKNGTYMISQPLAAYEARMPTGNFSPGRLVDFFEFKREERKNKLLETEDAKKILEFVFPVRKYMAMSTIFSTSVLSGYGEMPRLLDGAKSSLGMVFLICSKSPKDRLDFLSDLSQSEFMNQAMQSVTSDGTSLDCFDFPFNADLLKQFIEELIEIIKQMPSIVLRGIAKQIDPAYKEMRHHWSACDLKNLRNSDIRFLSAPGAPGGTRDKLVSGLHDESRRNNPDQDCKYVPIFPGGTADLGFSLYRIIKSFGADPVGWRAMGYTVSRMLAYALKGPAAMIDLSFAFSIPCLEVDENWGPKFNMGRYGRYGHPMTPITALALATPEINAERELRNKNCSDVPDDPDEQLCAEEEDSGLPDFYNRE